MREDPNLQLVYAYESSPAAAFDAIKQQLSRNDIQANSQPICELLKNENELNADVILGEGSGATLQKLYQFVSARGISLIAVIGDEVNLQQISSWSADAYCILSQPSDYLAALIWCVFRRGQERNDLAQKCSELEKKLEDTRLIGQAKSLLSRQLQITEVESFRRLRAESRRSHRKLADLARSLVDAEKIRKSVEESSSKETSSNRNGT